MKWGWDKRISPFSFGRFVGRKKALKFIGGYVENRQKVDNNEQAIAVRDYMYHIFMRPGTTEYALMICFELGFYSRIQPLGHPDKLSAANFPVSFFYGDSDWVRRVDMDAGRKVIDACTHQESRYHLVTNSDHNMQMDNPLEFANLIINDIFPDANMPIGFAPEENP